MEKLTYEKHLKLITDVIYKMIGMTDRMINEEEMKTTYENLEKEELKEHCDIITIRQTTLIETLKIYIEIQNELKNDKTIKKEINTIFKIMYRENLENKSMTIIMKYNNGIVQESLDTLRRELLKEIKEEEESKKEENLNEILKNLGIRKPK